MRDNARKYILDITQLQSYGIGSTGTSYQCSILEDFTVNINGTTCSYPQLTTEELGLLDKPVYEQRVTDYLEFLKIESAITKERLIEESSFFDTPCTVICKLNPDFLVYKFLDGVRVVNVGEANGYIEYKAYPVGEDPSGYTWQAHGTFLSLNLNLVYVFEVRDVFESEEFCKVQKTVSLPTLVVSTTFIAQEKDVFLDKRNENSSGTVCFNNGFICVNPTLSGIERVQIDFEIAAEQYGDAISCAEIYCKPNGSGTFAKYNCVTGDGLATLCNNVTMNSGDELCYNLSTIVPTAGSCGCACIDFMGVSGLGTTIPTIDVGRCCEDITSNIPVLDVTISTLRTSDTSTVISCTQNGSFIFSPAIPAGKCITLDISGITSTVLCGSSNYTIWCKANGAPLAQKVIQNCSANPQPSVDSVTVCEGDELTYRMSVSTALIGSNSRSSFIICDSDSSFGVNTIIGFPSGDTIYKCNQSASSIVSVCSQFNNNARMNGFINATNLSVGQCISVNLGFTTTVIGTGRAFLTVFCQPAGSTGYVQIACSRDADPTPGTQYFYCQGDSICYSGTAFTGVAGDSFAEIELLSVTGYNGISASINSCSTKQKDCVSASTIIC